MFAVTSGIIAKHVHKYFIKNIYDLTTWQELNFKQWNSVRIHLNVSFAEISV